MSEDPKKYGTWNENIRGGAFREFIAESELAHEREILRIASRALSTGARLLLVTGPSASGKTTLSHRLSRELEKVGLPPVRLSLDDYYLARDQIPFGEDGKRDFESVAALDVARFRRDLESLLSGRETEVPVFDFNVGARAKECRRLRLESGCAILAEGIHAFSRELETAGAPSFRVYAEAVPGDEYEEPSDARFIRRLVRDERCRAADWKMTFDMWPGVRRGEMQNLLPDKERADEYFNGFLPYEPCLLRRPAERVLRDAVGDEADRLRRELSRFPAEDAPVPPESILSEFIGGSAF